MVFESLYVHSMSKYDSPALFDPALFWGVALVILFCFHKSRKGKKEKGGRAAWPNLSSNGHDLFSFFLRGFYEPKSSHPALRQKTTDHQKPTPKPLRVFAPPRELISLPVVSLCPSVISREDAKARRLGFETLAKLRQTRPLPDKCIVSAPINRDPQRRLGPSPKKESFAFGSGPQPALGITATIPWVPRLLSEESAVFESH
jgi:hypothetical protein